jgi:hypothetical protein
MSALFGSRRYSPDAYHLPVIGTRSLNSPSFSPSWWSNHATSCSVSQEESDDREALRLAPIKTGHDCVDAGRMIDKSKATVYRKAEEFGLIDLLKRLRR